MIPVNRPLISKSDRVAVMSALDDGWISGEGPYVSGFERTLASRIHVNYAVAVSSGTSACDLLYAASNLVPGDKVVLPATTIISTATNAARIGCQIDLVDSDPLEWCATSQKTVERIDEDTKIVFPVHLFGLAVDMDPIVERAKQVGALVFEDAAEAIGLEYKGRPCGSLGDAGVFSFYANKTVTSGEGGAVVSGSKELSDSVRSLRNLSFSPKERFVHEALGYNARMPSLSAALANSQLNRLSSLLARKREIGNRYQEGLSGHPWFQLPATGTKDCENSYWVFGLILTSESPYNATEFREVLRNRGVDSRRFFCPLNLQPVLQSLGVVSKEPMPVSEHLWKNGLYLPSGIGNTDLEIDEVIETLWSLVK